LTRGYLVLGNTFFGDSFGDTRFPRCAHFVFVFLFLCCLVRSLSYCDWFENGSVSRAWRRSDSVPLVSRSGCARWAAFSRLS
jgi:hypothetical protein